MKDTLVLGIGNILMRDDGAGVYIVERLQKSCTMDNVRFVVGETDIGFCIDEIYSSDYLVVVDAFSEGKEPGAVGVHRLSEIMTAGYALSPHDIHILDLISYSDQRFEGTLISVEPKDISIGLGLSPLLQSRFENIVREVHMEVKELLSKLEGR